MADEFEATKELTIEGRVIGKGQLIPPSVPRDRVLAGLRRGSIRLRKPPVTGTPAAGVVNVTPSSAAAPARRIGKGS